MRQYVLSPPYVPPPHVAWLARTTQSYNVAVVCSAARVVRPAASDDTIAQTQLARCTPRTRRRRSTRCRLLCVKPFVSVKPSSAPFVMYTQRTAVLPNGPAPTICVASGPLTLRTMMLRRMTHAGSRCCRQASLRLRYRRRHSSRAHRLAVAGNADGILNPRGRARPAIRIGRQWRGILPD